MKCIVKGCKNHAHEGKFFGDLCSPCHEFITTGNGIHSQAYRNAIKEGLKIMQSEKIRNEADRLAAVLNERDACAKVCMAVSSDITLLGTAAECVNAIRARGNE